MQLGHWGIESRSSVWEQQLAWRPQVKKSPQPETTVTSPGDESQAAPPSETLASEVGRKPLLHPRRHIQRYLHRLEHITRHELKSALGQAEDLDPARAAETKELAKDFRHDLREGGSHERFDPADHSDRDRLIEIFKRTVDALIRVQDQETGLWYQVLDQAGREGNYLEASASCMMTYAIAKAVRLALLDGSYLRVVEQAYSGSIYQW